MLGTPAISKSTAWPFACCEVFLLPIDSHNASDLYPDVTVIGLSNLALTGSSIS